MKTHRLNSLFCLKSTLIMALLFISTSVFAQQKGEMAVGLNLNYGTNSTLSNMGLGAKFQWTVINNLRLEPSFNYYFGKSFEFVQYNMWDAGINAHYLFPIGNEKRFMLYPLVGIGLLGMSVDYDGEFEGLYDEVYNVGSYSSSDFAFNIGGGVEYLLTDRISLGAEIKYQIVSGWNRPIFTLGATYKF